MADFLTRSNVAVAGRVTGNRDLITSSSMLRWVAEGKVFGCGVGVENAGIDGAAALADVTPTFALVAPSSASTFVLPILVRIGVHTEGGALAQIMVGVTRAAADCATAMTISGTAFTAPQNMDSGNTAAPQSSCLYTCTASALTNADYVMLDLANAADNIVSGTGGVVFNRGTTYELDLIKTPHLLRSGAALLVWSVTGTTDTKNIPYFVFAELTADDLY